jgi:hypothetical protein
MGDEFEEEIDVFEGSDHSLEGHFSEYGDEGGPEYEVS